LCETGIQCQSEQSGLTLRVDTIERQRDLGGKGRQVHDPHTPRPLGDEQAAVGREGKRPGNFETGQYRFDAKPHTISRGEFL
jgi:hypothetical protein